MTRRRLHGMDANGQRSGGEGGEFGRAARFEGLGIVSKSGNRDVSNTKMEGIVR